MARTLKRDTYGRVTELSVSRAGQTIARRERSYDGRGKPRSLTVDGTLQEVSYDAQRRLVRAGTLRLIHDDVGRTTRVTRDKRVDKLSHDTAGRLTRIDGAQPRSYRYDARGQATQVGDLCLKRDAMGRKRSAGPALFNARWC